MDINENTQKAKTLQNKIIALNEKFDAQCNLFKTDKLTVDEFKYRTTEIVKLQNKITSQIAEIRLKQFENGELAIIDKNKKDL